MPVYINDSKVLIDSEMVAIAEACCCGGGACCHGTICDIETEADCVGSGGIYGGDGTTCTPNPCLHIGACCQGLTCVVRTRDDCTLVGGTFHEGDTCSDFNGPTCFCFEFAASVSIVLSSVTIPGCCIPSAGISYRHSDCGGDGCINSTYVASDFVTFPPYVFFGAVDFRIDRNEYDDGESCTGDPVPGGELRAPNIVVGCTESGWFIEAWDQSLHPIFAAHGVSDPTTSFVNELTCGFAPSTSIAFPDPTSLAIGHAGTATIS